MRVVIIVLFLFIKGDFVKPIGNVEKENWGYISVREGAQMFFWAYFTKNYTHQPLILWLQGGPGDSSTGVGSFLEIGPQDIHGKERKYAWTRNASIVFIDSPVGSGYSYVWNKELIPRSDVAAASDLLTFLRIFFKQITDIYQSPLYIFGESYGGKIAAELALQLTKAIKKKRIYCNFKGIALGDPWVSPVDSIDNYANFLYANSLIDTEGLAPISAVASNISKEISKGRNSNATKLYLETMEPLITNETNGVNFYNILTDPNSEYGESNDIFSIFSKRTKFNGPNIMLPRSVYSDLSYYMNVNMKKYLRIPKNVTWSSQSNLVYNALSPDFMRSAVDTVETLLNETSLEVMVYNGQLDLFVPSTGSESWVRKLKWTGMTNWTKTDRKPLLSTEKIKSGYYKKYKNFSFFWILQAGHMVPFDAPSAALDMLCTFLFGKC